MWIKSIRVQNYKCFLDSGEIELTSRFNVIVGKNNSGKTALVEALSIKMKPAPFNSVDVQANGIPKMELNIFVNQDEWRRLALRENGNYIVSVSDRNTTETKIIETLTASNVIIQLDFSSNSIQGAYIPMITRTPNVTQHLVPQGGGYLLSGRGGQSITETIAGKTGTAFVNQKYIYAFKAERLNVGQSGIAPNLKLANDASNLPQVLHHLITENFSMYERFVSHVSQVFPDIKWIAAPLISNSEAKIHLWFVERETERQDLAMPLQESGTGVGQVLAILYLVVTSDKPRTIIIDEPQSFLHPGAVRRLFSLLRQHYPQHQYIVTTHSPTVIAAASPENIVLLEKDGFESKGRNIEVGTKDDMFNVLNSVGASLSDVFGADNILWVEGATEEKAFSLLVTRKIQLPLLGTVIMGVRNTGDVVGGNKKTRENIKGIYDKLSNSAALIPPSIGFLFDREGLTKQEMEDLQRMGNIHFLDRIMYENYLLIPEAIAKLISELENFSEEEISVDIVNQWLEDNKWNYGRRIPEDQRSKERWLRDVHGANLLHALFDGLSDKRYNYEKYKVYYGERLTEIILELEEEGEIVSDFDEIVKLLGELLQPEEE